MAPSVPTARPASTAPAIRLQRLAAAGCVDHLQLDAVLLEDAGLGAELRDGGIPVAALPDGELDEIVGAGRRGEQCRGSEGE